MANHEIVRSWKDPEFRAALTEERRAALPENPAGIVELPEVSLEVQGGCQTMYACMSMDPSCIYTWYVEC